MRILVLGGGGMLGHMACRVLGRSHDVIGTSRAPWDPTARLARFCTKDRWIAGVDAFRWDTIVSALAQSRPDLVLNAIGIVKQRAEAMDPLISININSLFPHHLASLCDLMNAKLIHVSTDCVFSGNRGRYSESDIPDPVDLYGRTKLLGEACAKNALTLRASMIGRQVSGTTGLVEWFLSQRNGNVTGYRGAVFSGLTTEALCMVIAKILDLVPTLSGLWHVSSAPISKYDVLSELNRLFSLNIAIKEDTRTVCDRSLDGSRFQSQTGISVPPWHDMLESLRRDNHNYESE